MNMQTISIALSIELVHCCAHHMSPLLNVDLLYFEHVALLPTTLRDHVLLKNCGTPACGRLRTYSDCMSQEVTMWLRASMSL
jgi:hypothetical protein